jgi:hypothetical protein
MLPDLGSGEMCCNKRELEQIGEHLPEHKNVDHNES